jgi:hypothetical protein
VCQYSLFGGRLTRSCTSRRRGRHQRGSHWPTRGTEVSFFCLLVQFREEEEDEEDDKAESEELIDASDQTVRKIGLARQCHLVHVDETVNSADEDSVNTGDSINNNHGHNRTRRASCEDHRQRPGAVELRRCRSEVTRPTADAGEPPAAAEHNALAANDKIQVHRPALSFFRNLLAFYGWKVARAERLIRRNGSRDVSFPERPETKVASQMEMEGERRRKRKR